MSLVARHLEAEGIATVIIGSAQDIVETAGVPRFVFVDYPLGNPCGRPGATDEQRFTVEAALQLVTSAVAPRMTQRLPLEWGTDEWRSVYMHVGPDNIEALREAGRQRMAKQQARKTGASADAAAS